MQANIQPAVAVEADIATRAKHAKWMLGCWLVFYFFSDHDWGTAGKRVCLWMGIAYAGVCAIAIIASAGIWLREKVARKVVLPD